MQGGYGGNLRANQMAMESTPWSRHGAGLGLGTAVPDDEPMACTDVCTSTAYPDMAMAHGTIFLSGNSTEAKKEKA